MANFVKGLKKLPFYEDESVPVERIKTKNGEIAFAMYGTTTEFRVRTLMTKEPETIAWIETFQAGEVFWDIGANIGCYSLYAAKKGVEVEAFEPAAVNYWLLTKNITINDMKQITAYPFALSDRNEVRHWEPNGAPGAGDNQVFEPGSLAGVQTYRMDYLVSHANIRFPNHIKLDVDGIEKRVLLGGKRTLEDERMRSVMCEVNEEREEAHWIVKYLEQMGFGAPVTRHSPYFNDYYYAPSFNYLFIK